VSKDQELHPYIVKGQISLFETPEDFKDLSGQSIYFGSEINKIEPIYRANDIGGIRVYYRHGPEGKPIFYKSVTAIIGEETGSADHIELALLKMNHQHSLTWFAHRGTLVGTLTNIMLENTIMQLKGLDGHIEKIIEDQNLYELQVSDSLILFCQKSLMAVAKWMLDYQVETKAIEPIIYDDEEGFAGAIDWVGTLILPEKKKRTNWIVDYKASKYTSQKETPDSYAIQLRGYVNAWNKLHPEFPVDSVANLITGKDWKTWKSPYSFIDQTTNPRQYKWDNILANNRMLPLVLPKKTVIEGELNLNQLDELEGLIKKIELEEYYKKKVTT